MAEDRLEQLDYYTLLGVDDGASTDAIRSAYHAFALKYHPDRHVGGSPRRLARATQIFRRGAEAYKVLIDAELRRRYDQGLARGQLRLSRETERPPPPSPVAGYRSQIGLKARPFCQRAEQAVKAGDWATAKLNLQIALGHEPNNEEIKAKLEALSNRVR